MTLCEHFPLRHALVASLFCPKSFTNRNDKLSPSSHLPRYDNEELRSPRLVGMLFRQVDTVSLLHFVGLVDT